MKLRLLGGCKRNMVENVLINGSCSGSMIHPGLFEIIFTSLTLPVAQRQSRLPIPLITFKESTGWGSQIQTMLERSVLFERNAEASLFSSVTSIEMLPINIFRKKAGTIFRIYLTLKCWLSSRIFKMQPNFELNEC